MIRYLCFKTCCHFGHSFWDTLIQTVLYVCILLLRGWHLRWKHNRKIDVQSQIRNLLTNLHRSTPSTMLWISRLEYWCTIYRGCKARGITLGTETWLMIHTHDQKNLHASKELDNSPEAVEQTEIRAELPQHRDWNLVDLCTTNVDDSLLCG